MRDVGIAQLGNEGDGILKLGNAGGDDDGIDRGAGGAGALHEALLSQLQLPQVGVEKKGVELVGATRCQQLVELCDAISEDLLGDLATARKLSPEAGIGGSGDDLGVNRRRRHACEQDRRLAGQPGEAGLGVDAAVGQGHDGWCIRRPRCCQPRGGTRGDQFTVSAPGGRRDDADATGAQLTCREPCGDVAGPKIEQPFRPGAHGCLERLNPVDRVDDRAHCEVACPLRVQAAGRGPGGGKVGCLGEIGVMEGKLGCQGLEDRCERRTTRGLAIALGLLSSGNLFEARLDDRQTAARTADDNTAAAIAHASDDPQRCRQVRENPVNLFGPDVRDAQHGVAEQTATTAHELRSSADQARDGEQLDVVDAGQRLGSKVPLRVTDDGRRRENLRVDALTVQRTDPGKLRQQDARQRDTRRAQHVRVRQGRRVIVLGGLSYREDVHPRQRRERDTSTSELAHNGSELRLGLTDQRFEVSFQRIVAHEVGQRLQPWRALTAEAHCVRGSVNNAVHESAAALGRADRGKRCVDGRHVFSSGTAVSGSTGGTTSIAKHEGNLNFNARLSSCFSRDVDHVVLTVRLRRSA